MIKSGFSEKQAEGLAVRLQKVDLSHLATKEDIAELRYEIRENIAELKADIFKWIVPLMLGQLAGFAIIMKFLMG